MHVDSNNNGNGSGHGLFEGGVPWDDEGPIHDAIGRLVNVMVSEAVKRRCGTIVVGIGDDCCPVHFVRGSESLKMDSLPLRVYGLLRDRLTRLCGEDCQTEGAFTTSLKRTETSTEAYCEVRVEVIFADAGLQLALSATDKTVQ